MELHLVATDVLPTQLQQLRDSCPGENAGADRSYGLRVFPAVNLGCVERFHQGTDFATTEQPFAASNLRLSHALQRVARVVVAQLP